MTDESSPESNIEVSDTVERAVTIDAPIDTVWRLASVPGWWINAGEVVDHEISWDGDVATVQTEFGPMQVEQTDSREPSYVSFRWLGGTSGQAEPLPTLVEFFLTEGDGGTQLRVIESGWASFEPSDYVRRNYADNISGWESELAAARTFLEA